MYGGVLSAGAARVNSINNVYCTSKVRVTLTTISPISILHDPIHLGSHLSAVGRQTTISALKWDPVLVRYRT